jgi:hypothetical protein
MKQPKNPQTESIFANYISTPPKGVKHFTANTDSKGRFIVSYTANDDRHELRLTDEAAKYLAIQIRRHFRNEEGKEG